MAKGLGKARVALALLAALGCGGAGSPEQAEREATPGARERTAAGAADDTSLSAASDRELGSDDGALELDPSLPLLCASCDGDFEPGGDTTDFGASAVGCPPRRFEIAIEESDAGVALLAALEGRHEFALRWNDAVRSATTLVLELRRTGRAAVFERCATQIVAPQVEVRFATADRAVEGSFVGLLRTGLPPQVSYWVSWQSGRDGWWVEGNGAEVRGSLAFEVPAAEPATYDAHHLRVSLAAVQGAGVDRGELTVGMWQASSNPLVLIAPRVVQVYRALPADGCSIYATTRADAACDPWAQHPVAPALPQRGYLAYHANPCCEELGAALPARPDAPGTGDGGTP